MADYGYQHRQTRAQWEPIVNTGRVTCTCDVNSWSALVIPGG